MFDEIFGKITLLLENKSTKVAVLSLIIATVIIFIILLLLNAIKIDPQSNLPEISLSGNLQLFAACFYLTLFFLIWFILYLQSSKEGVDVYAQVREKLAGYWVVTYSANTGPLSEKIVMPPRTIPCEIRINDSKKLEMIFSIKDHPIFADEDRQIIKNIAIRHNEEAGYNMLFYYVTKRTLQPSFASYIVPEAGQANSDTVEIEAFGQLTFNIENRSVKKIQGRWFDLNGNNSRLIALLDTKLITDIRNENFQKMRLSEVPIHQKYFDADMGSIEFLR